MWHPCRWSFVIWSINARLCQLQCWCGRCYGVVIQHSAASVLALRQQNQACARQSNLSVLPLSGLLQGSGSVHMAGSFSVQIIKACSGFNLLAEAQAQAVLFGATARFLMVCLQEEVDCHEPELLECQTMARYLISVAQLNSSHCAKDCTSTTCPTSNDKPSSFPAWSASCHGWHKL